MRPAGRIAPFGAAFGCLLAFACDGGGAVVADSGRDATLQVEGAEFVRASMPAPSGGPEVATVQVVTDRIRPGQLGKSCNGSVGTRATAALMALDGDLGYWVVKTGVGDVETPTLPSFRTRLSFARSLSPGDHQLDVRAVDADGHVGAPFVRTLTAEAGSPSGELSVTLSWENDADLDLHVVDPGGAEIWKRNVNSIPPPKPGEVADPEAWKRGGVLDFDSNAACVIDGRRREIVRWERTPPAGHYVVRVETASLCKAPAAHWKVEATRGDGTSLGASSGTSTDTDTRLPHGLGSGILALDFDVP